MVKQVTITAKISGELKRRLDRLGVNVSELVRESLELQARRLEKDRLRRLAQEAGEILRKIPEEELVKAIREGREGR